MQKEKAIQNAIIRYLNSLPGCMAVEYYNNSKFSPKLNRFLPTNQALRPKGMPDILVIYNGTTFWIEVKAEKGVLSSEQKLMHEKMVRLGWRVCVCRSVRDAQKCVETLACRESSGRSEQHEESISEKENHQEGSDQKGHGQEDR
jgi:hypothetical protein